MSTWFLFVDLKSFTEIIKLMSLEMLLQTYLKKNIRLFFKVSVGFMYRHDETLKCETF